MQVIFPVAMAACLREDDELDCPVAISVSLIWPDRPVMLQPNHEKP